jgi:RNA polymerase sigma-70 factor, ECF subfamily
MEDLNAALDRSLIGDALARLSPQHRAVVRRSYYLGWTTARIADDLHISDDTVKSRLHQAMRALRLILQETGLTGVDRNGRTATLPRRVGARPRLSST